VPLRHVQRRKAAEAGAVVMAKAEWEFCVGCKAAMIMCAEHPGEPLCYCCVCVDAIRDYDQKKLAEAEARIKDLEATIRQLREQYQIGSGGRS
jgi:hypothetical protein